MNRRQALAGLSTAAATLALAPNRSLALESVSPISYTEAKELGLTFRAFKVGNSSAVGVEVKFALKGKLEGVKRVSLFIRDGEKLLVNSTLSNGATAAGQFEVYVVLDRDFWDKSKLWISSSLGGASVGSTYELKVADIEEVKRLR